MEEDWVVIRLEHIRLMIRQFYKRPVKIVCKRFLVHHQFLYFGIRWFDNIKEITVGEVKI